MEQHESLRPHVHVSTSSRDCDGPLYTGRTIMAEREDWERAIFCGPSLTPQDVARGMAERYAQPTLIGTFTRSYVDPSCAEDAWQRDVFAEAAGY